jgi:hypothetical protein
MTTVIAVLVIAGAAVVVAVILRGEYGRWRSGESKRWHDPRRSDDPD